MKKTLLIICILSFMASSVWAGSVRGYYRKDGTYVQPHQRSNPDNTRTNNYGSPSNYYEKANPYSRDQDRDGIPNYLDRDDNNDGRDDDSHNSHRGLYRK